eukprot:6201602-Pleurochrysis_carterae.AAC.1
MMYSLRVADSLQAFLRVVAVVSSPLIRSSLSESSCRIFRQSASVTYSPIRHWESGDRMAPLT